MRKYLPFIISFFCLLVSILFWDKITLPYDESNSIIGQYSLKKINPLNDLLRFLIFIIPATLIYLVSFLYFNKSTYNLNKNNSEYFLSDSFKINGKQNLDNYFYLFLALIIIEFFSFNFRNALIIDTFHDSVFLTPPTNYLVNEGFFSSTLYDYGFTGNNLGLFFNYFFGFYTLGSINFVKLLLILFIKLLLILISKKLIEYLNYGNFLKKIFFILFTFVIISLPNYYDLSSHFSPRSVLYLLVILLIGSSLCEKKTKI